MNEMIFKDILIADLAQKTARYVSFETGLNVITSKDNHVGKSSLLKSLYYTLGAEVEFDQAWDKQSKITAVRIIVNNIEFRIARFTKKFAIFKENELVLITESVTKELAPKLEEIFNFSIYLAEKGNDKRIIQAPPAFTFMPYYIDQDNGWSAMYKSFNNLEQFEKRERIKSIYFHLGLYNKWTIERMSECDRIKDEITKLKKRENNIRVTIENLLSDIQNLIVADNEAELEKQLLIPKEKIESLVKKAGEIRNSMQALQTKLQQHEYQLNVIEEYHKLKSPDLQDNITIHCCPKCGYQFDDEIYSLVRSNYKLSNEDYLLQQIKLIIDSIKKELEQKMKEYVKTMDELHKQEEVYDESQNVYEVYIKHRGLGDTVKKYQIELEENIITQITYEDRIKNISKELKNIDGKKEIEEQYIEFVESNIIKLNAWHSSFVGKIKLLRPITAQGSLEGKIVLSQYIGLFQTMEAIKSSVIRFPFVVDSPRGQEASEASSIDILKMISEINCLPQVIVATVDYDKYMSSKDANVIELKEMRKLLNVFTYNKMEQEINELFDIFMYFKK